MIDDENHVEKNLIWQGDLDAVDSLDSKYVSSAHFVVIFMRTDITRRAWLMEAPSTSEGALRSVEFADGAVLLSQCPHSLQQEDLCLFENILRRCPPSDPQRPLDHILLIRSCCSNCRTEEADEVSGRIAENGSEQLSKLAFEFLQENKYIESIPRKEELTARIQPFSREDSHLREQTLARIHNLAGYLLEIRKELAENCVEHGFNRLNRVLDINIQISGALLYSEETNRHRISETDHHIDRFRKESEHIMTRFAEFIKYCSAKKSFELRSIDSYYETITSEDSLTAFIEYSFETEEQARREIGNYIGQLIASKLESTLKKSSEAISEGIEKLILQWQKALPSVSKLQFSVKEDRDCYEVLSFDPETAFTTGQKKLDAAGVRTFSKTSSPTAGKESPSLANANGYLLPLDPPGSSDRDFSPVDALGRPITTGIDIASVLRRSEYKSDGGPWQRSLAKEVSRLLNADSSIKENGVRKTIGDFWDTANLAVQKGLEEMRRQSNAHIELLTKDMARDYKESELDDYRWTALKIADSLSQIKPPRYIKSLFLTFAVFLSLTLGTFVIYFLLSTPVKQGFIVP